ncbi:unnamed protein product [Eruca vesicaria subsp. sativa]|uniref:Exostosin GT47 domain-containing protein n=1 Tax=Eruca vesicaria subsp. sativa TaxID=29727 RepID=A0ABC8LBH4_ERUVS|nr:unnamed protein product [Eruca vesicaria subsp. sativa]
MMKPVPRLRVIISATFVFCLFVVFQIYKSDLFEKNYQITHQVNNIFISIASSSHHQTPNLTKYSNESDGNRAKPPEDLEETDTCAGRYIYMHNLPSIFNDDIIKNCRALNKWFNMCPFMVNSGLGPQVLEYDNKTSQVLTTKTGSWYSTNQFLLSVIFRERMKHYECLTNDSSLASAIYVPYYAGFDVSRHLWGYNTTVRDALATKLAKWLRERPEWRKLHGRDHFFVTGRIGWDFRRCWDEEWGSNLMCSPEFSNTTMLSIETTAWTNEFAVPYPTYFHPESLTEVRRWQRKVKRVKRRHLFCFVGAPRPKQDGSIRGEIIKQCLASQGVCKFLNCNEPGNDCDNPVKIMDVFKSSVFCLQPPGDSYTRRSIFDSILAGCIPVFFHPGSAYNQYMWYFPKDYTKYSVYIPESGVKNGTVSIRELLGRIGEESVSRMRKEVVKIIPKIIYTKPGLVRPENKVVKIIPKKVYTKPELVGLEKIEDAFDIAVGKVIERVAMVKRMMEEGKDLHSEYSQTRDLKKLE